MYRSKNKLMTMGKGGFPPRADIAYEYPNNSKLDGQKFLHDKIVNSKFSQHNELSEQMPGSQKSAGPSQRGYLK